MEGSLYSIANLNQNKVFSFFAEENTNFRNGERKTNIRKENERKQKIGLLSIVCLTCSHLLAMGLYVHQAGAHKWKEMRKRMDHLNAIWQGKCHKIKKRKRPKNETKENCNTMYGINASGQISSIKRLLHVTHWFI